MRKSSQDGVRNLQIFRPREKGKYHVDRLGQPVLALQPIGSMIFAETVFAATISLAISANPPFLCSNLRFNNSRTES
jgi:hypothetical protein